MDEQYIKRVTEGDANAFAYLINKYKDKAFSVALSVIRNSSQAEDIVQEAFIKAYKNLHSFRGDAAFSTWLMRIVVNESIKVIRKNKTKRESEVELKQTEDFTALNESLEQLKKQEQKKVIDLVFDKMPEREAMVLQLFYLHDYSINEMEQVLDQNAGNIKVILYRARKRFYKILSKELKYEFSSLV